jgi:hypothetical protein
LYRVLNERIWELEAQGMSSYQLRAESKKLKAEAEAELEPLWQRVSRVQKQSYQERSKHERYCREQRELLRALEDLTANERLMYALDNRKDQIMTICKLALANLVMWVRERVNPKILRVFRGFGESARLIRQALTWDDRVLMNIHL